MAHDDVRLPVTGQPAGFTLDGRAVVVWWGPRYDDQDVAAARGGRVLVFPSPEACLATAVEQDWPMDPEALPDDWSEAVTDLSPARSSRRPSVMCVPGGFPVRNPPRAHITAARGRRASGERRA